MIHSNCQKLNNVSKPLISSTNCAPPSEFLGSSINSREISDVNIDNITPSQKTVIEHNDLECSAEQAQNIQLSGAMDISSDSLQPGRVAKLIYSQYDLPD